MPTTETNVRNLRINRLTNEQYETAVKSDTELYLTPDTTDADIASAIAAHNSDTTSHSNKQDKLTTQTAYSAKGSATKVPQITTNTLGQVTGITEVDITHQSIKTLKTNNTTAQTASSSEAIAGSGTINLHKVSKTGSYSDLLNKPTIPATNVIPATTTANKVLVSTTTSGTAKWSDFSSAGFLKTNSSGVVSVDTNSYYLSSNPNGYTSNAGTVTSVRVQAGIGLSSSTSTAQSSTLNTTISVASGYKLPTTTEWSGKQDALPSQTGNSGKFLTTNGSALSWASASAEVDNSTITKNESDQIQTVGYKDVRTNNTLKTWTGTREQYDAITTKDANTLYNITNDSNNNDILAMLSVMYPVGAIYIGTMNTCPLATLGVGTWEKVATDRVLQGAGTRGNVGTTINESLPNIKGNVYNIGGIPNTTGVTADGAFSRVSASSSTGMSTGGSDTYVRVDINASRSSSTYQDNAPVQQNAYLVNVWRRTV